MANNGADVLLYVDETAVAKQTGLSRSTSTPTIDVSHKLSELDEFIPGRGSGTMTLNALWVPTHSAYLALRAAQLNKELISIRVVYDGDAWEDASALITQFDEDWPDNAASTMTINLQINGSWSTTGGNGEGEGES
jgi:hypothetical protein